MRRILIDLTDIQDWHGHHGGTQRVVYGIAKQFYLQRDDKLEVEFIAFSPGKSLFYKTSFTPLFDRTEDQKIAPHNLQPQASAATIQAQVKRLVRPYVPDKLRRSKYARAAAKKAYMLGKGVTHRVRRSIHGRGRLSLDSSSHEKIKFSNNDIVVVLGKPWDNPNMEQVLIDEKSNTGFKLVQVVYDLIIPLYPHLHHPSLFKAYTQYMFEAIYGSDLLLPISKSSEKDIKIFARSLNLPIPKTKVIRLADEIINQPGKGGKPDNRIASKFIACIGTVEIRKNHMLIYYAYKLAEQQGIELPQLVVVGSRGWLTGDFQYLIEHDPRIKDKIIILDNVNDQGLSWIYANCIFSVYPSFYEGWGLPVAESLANGKMCIASNSSSIPEIAGDLIDYFTPYDAGACLDLMIKYLDPKTLKQKETQIKEKYKATSWDDTFNEVIEYIDKV
jgi:glycosyltransferase involved in cell wall biosynthesis